MAIKAIILIGGPNKGQRFRPLSFDSPKYMFPVGGQSILGHLIKSALKLQNLSEIILLGFYQQDDNLSQSNLQRMVNKFISEDSRSEKSSTRIVNIRYLQEFTRMGTAGGLYHFRDQIRHGNPNNFLVINGDICGDFDFKSMLEQHLSISEKSTMNGDSTPYVTVMATEADQAESLNYGCIVENESTHQIRHYVEKPSTFVSNLINCGAYICNIELLNELEKHMQKKRNDPHFDNRNDELMSPLLLPMISQLDSHPDYVSLELNILRDSSLQEHCYVYKTRGQWWCQMKTAASAIYANRQYLKQYKKNVEYDGSNQKCHIIGHVYIHPNAIIDSSAVIGPNVTIMEHVNIGPGVRVRESILLESVVIHAHSFILCSIVGKNCTIGSWARLEGTPSEPGANQEFAKVHNPPLFSLDGKLNPSISVLGCDVKIADATIILNTIVLSHKELSRSYRNEIAL